MGGEHARLGSGSTTNTGSSPRGRGTHHEYTPQFLPRRIIPAWAGNTPVAVAAVFSHTDHPRVGGEHNDHNSLIQNNAGSSPRGRGTPPSRTRCPAPRRIIPAWAGNTRIVPFGSLARTDHPRVGGEHADARYHHFADIGSSPRGRGTRLVYGQHPQQPRIIPAWAGNTIVGSAITLPISDHPRVGGEHLDSVILQQPGNGSSPRGRGTRSARPDSLAR